MNNFNMRRHTYSDEKYASWVIELGGRRNVVIRQFVYTNENMWYVHFTGYTFDRDMLPHTFKSAFAAIRFVVRETNLMDDDGLEGGE